MTPCQHKSRRHRPAFTLVEALLVVSMVGVLLPIALFCINNCQRAAAVVTQRAQALEIATNQMNLAIAQQTWQTDQQDEIKVGGATYHWATHIQNWVDDPDDSNLYELHVDVTWPDGNKQTRSVSLVTLVYLPTAETSQ